ncbi:MAG: ABC transporter permease [Nitrososphaerales archaeon]|nr:ABC transporter permease [Nitrososphaerales archaeon]
MGLGRYIIRRLIYMVPLFIGISLVSFVVMYAAGDPIKIVTAANPRISQAQRAALSAYYGLNLPLPEQYLRWLTNLAQGNFGTSFFAGLPVSQLIWNWLPNTVELQVVSIALSLVIGIPIGIYSALHRYSKPDVGMTVFALFGISMPTFWIGIILIFIFSYVLGWFPSAGAYGYPVMWCPGGVCNPLLDHLGHLFLPTMVLTYVSLALNVRVMRSAMLDVMRQDYILAARASGLKERLVVYKHAARNAITPVVTFLGLSIGAILGGAPLTETVFNWPGLGRLFVNRVGVLDFPTIMGITMIITLMTLIANLITDLSYAWIDPRIRIE